MFKLKFWKEAAERAIKTGCQMVLVGFGLVAVVTNGAAPNAFTYDWIGMIGTFLAGAFISVLTSIVSLPFGPSDSASLVAVNDAVPPGN